ncbi:MAG: cell division protein CrgA [Ancrocorticia sp.]|uniref:cell division protein CrgA n=1 Tax=Ancrocorticia sp. TaxID=2593684 RepID=UPI003F927CF6
MAESEKNKGAKGTKRGIEEQKSTRDAPRPKKSTDKKVSPRWWAPLMVTLMVIGLIIVVVAYLFGGNAPIPGLGNGNLFLGFGVMLVGFLMTMGWH